MRLSGTLWHLLRKIKSTKMYIVVWCMQISLLQILDSEGMSWGFCLDVTIATTRNEYPPVSVFHLLYADWQFRIAIIVCSVIGLQTQGLWFSPPIL